MQHEDETEDRGGYSTRERRSTPHGTFFCYAGTTSRTGSV